MYKSLILLLLNTLFINVLWSNDYTLNINDDMTAIKVTICSKHPLQLTSSLDNATRYLSKTSSHVEILNGHQLRLTKPDSCHWLIIPTNTESTAMTGQLLKVPTGLLMWRNEQIENDVINVQLPKAANTKLVNHSLPLPKINHDQYKWPEEPSFMSLFAYFGDFSQKTLRISEQSGSNLSLQINLLSKTLDSQYDSLITWINQVARSLVATSVLSGEQTVQLNLFASHSSESVPFAMVYRGEGTSIDAQINPQASLSQLKTDWTLYHEFAHLALPFIDRNDAWLSEGLASYLQYPLMQKASVLDEREAIEELWHGIRRGQTNYQELSKPNLTLAQLSSNMMEFRSFKQVYWRGAIFWFQVDLKLRANGDSLVRLLNRFNRCCRDLNSIWQGESLSAVLDQQIDYPFIQQLVTQYNNSTQFPQTDRLFNSIGISIGNDNQIKVLDRPKLNRFFANFKAH